jgi:hypothetical protein
MSKKKVLEELKGLTDLPMDSLKRLSVYDLNKLLSNLKGVKVDDPKIDKIKAKKIRKKREKKIREFSDDEEDDNDDKDDDKTLPAPTPLVRSPNDMMDIEEELPQNEIINDDTIEKSIAIPKDTFEKSIAKPKGKDSIEEKPKKKRGRPKKPKDKKEVSIQEEVMEIPQKGGEEGINPPHETAKSSTSKKKKVNEKTEIKNVITEFQKNISLLLQQYKKVKSPTDKHVNNLIEYYNEYNDDALNKIQDVIDKYRFVDDSVIEWTNSLIEKQKIRVERVVG